MYNLPPKLIKFFIFLIFILLSDLSFADIHCPPLESKYGNRDYLNPKNRDYIKTVENAHFNENVRQLKGGARASSGGVAGDLRYTLNWFPNHHHALDALVRLAIRENTSTPIGLEHIECRFQWAKAVNPKDGMVYFIEARYYFEKGNNKLAESLLEKAAELSPNDANVLYNVGLLYFSMGQYDSALRHAKSAYALGFPLPGLRNMLKKEGYYLGS